jgi:hypothetical protein
MIQRREKRFTRAGIRATDSPVSSLVTTPTPFKLNVIEYYLRLIKHHDMKKCCRVEA